MKRLFIIFIFLSFLLFPVQVRAAISILDAAVSEGFDSAVSTITKSFTNSTGSNRLLLVCVVMEDNVDLTGRITSMTYGGNALTEAIVVISPDTFLYTGLWYLLDANFPAAGAHDVVANISSGANEAGIGIWTLQNVTQGAPKDTDSYSSNSDDTNALTGWTGINATDIVIDCGGSGAQTGTWSQAGTQTELFDLLMGPTTPGASMAASYDFGVTSMTETQSGGVIRFGHIGAAWAEVAADGGGIRRRLTVFGVGP